jgi:hypothetical protein
MNTPPSLKQAHDTAVLREISEMLQPSKLGTRGLVPPVFANAISVKKARNWTLAIAYFLGVHVAAGAIYYCWRWLVSKRSASLRRYE